MEIENQKCHKKKRNVKKDLEEQKKNHLKSV